MSTRTHLRALLRQPGIVAAPGAYDCVSALVIAATGFPAVYMTGNGVSAAYLGAADVGLLTLTEMAGQAARIAAAVSVPVITDADTGYGNPLNVTRTVQEYERAGVAALHIEDQTFPKRCGNMEGKTVIPRPEMVQKVRAAVRARQDPDLVIIARTDARDPHGIADAIARGRAYAEAGADMVFVEGPRTREEIERVARELRGIPLVFNNSASGKVPPINVADLEALGFKLVIFPTHALYAATRAVQQFMAALRETGDPRKAPVDLVDFESFNSLIGLDRIRELEREFVTEG
ncbi:MAG: isocitrate lyase/PEP mutase family protein [Chloroflexi bacterium]|nr:isocitrate lyase/PEP mutase family protein [Chloroflexota bacterium]